MKIDPNAPAHPTYATGMMGEGLTIRAHFAACALTGIIAQANEPMTDKEAARRAVWCADALIAELNK